MYMLPLFDQTLMTHTSGVFLFATSNNSVKQFWRRRVCNKFSLFKMSLAINLPIMYLAAPFEQTLITHTQRLFVCNIKEFCTRSFGDDF